MKPERRFVCALINRRLPTCTTVIALTLWAAGAAFAQVDPRPQLTAFDFSCTAGCGTGGVGSKTINVSAASSTVNVTFTVTDAQGDATYFEMGFANPSGIVTRRGATSFAPSGSFSGSVNVTFPQYAADGPWTALYVFLIDAAGNTNFISPIPTGSGSPFPMTMLLTVTSVTDTTSPNLTAFSFTPASI